MTDAAPISPAAQEALWNAFKTAARDEGLSGNDALAVELIDASEAVRAEFEGVTVSIDTTRHPVDPPRRQVMGMTRREITVFARDETTAAHSLETRWRLEVSIIGDHVRTTFTRRWETTSGSVVAEISTRTGSGFFWITTGQTGRSGSADRLSDAYDAAMFVVRETLPEADD